MRFTTQLLPSRSGNLGILLLNNPKPLHALTLEMVYFMRDVLQEWTTDDTVQAILLKSSSDTKVPTFCAGGDVKQVYTSALQETKRLIGQGEPSLGSADFFRHEYVLNHQIATSKKPHIALWDGVVMGGGVGISIHGKYRIATERTQFAMPETKIGFFPDVGSTWWMPRLLPHSLAVYLALTGQRLNAMDTVSTGLATHYVPSSKLEALQEALVKATDEQKSIATVLMSFHEMPPEDDNSSLKRDRPLIDQTFGEDILKNRNKSVEKIVESLKQLNVDDFCSRTLEQLQQMSPTSLKVTLEALRRGAECVDIGEALHMEYRLSQAFMREGSDFYEGIRAALVDKDGKPQWNPSRLEDVSDEKVQSYFAPLKHEWEIPSSKL